MVKSAKETVIGEIFLNRGDCRIFAIGPLPVGNLLRQGQGPGPRQGAGIGGFLQLTLNRNQVADIQGQSGKPNHHHV